MIIPVTVFIIQNQQYVSSTIIQIQTQIQSVDAEIRFLNIIIGIEKIFRISNKTKINKIDISFLKQNIQIDQRSDMNIISTFFAKQLDLSLKSFAEIEFVRLYVKIVDHYETLFQY